MKFGKINHLSSLSDTWELVEEKNITVATNSITFSSLTGNTAEIYLLEYSAINDDASATSLRLQINSDSANNYGYQYMYSTGSTQSAVRDTVESSWLLTASPHDQNEICGGSMIIYSATGYERTALETIIGETSGTTVEGIMLKAFVYSNTSTEITSITINASQTSGIGVNSYFALYKKVV